MWAGETQTSARRRMRECGISFWKANCVLLGRRNYTELVKETDSTATVNQEGYSNGYDVGIKCLK